MRRLATLAALILPLAATAAGAPRVAVWSVKPLEGAPTRTAGVLAEIVAAELAKTGRFQVLSNSDVVAMLSFEQQRQALGCSELDCISAVGKTLQVDYVVSGTLGVIGSQYHLTLVAAESGKGSPAGRAARLLPAEDDALAPAAQAAVTELVAQLPTTPPPRADGKPGAPQPASDGPALISRADALRKERPREAAALYDEYLRRYPQGEQRCVAALFAGTSLEAAKDEQGAAERYIAFGSDAVCSARVPDVAARALDQAGSSLERASRFEDAAKAWTALAGLEGVKDPALRVKVEQARMRTQPGVGGTSR